MQPRRYSRDNPAIDYLNLRVPPSDKARVKEAAGERGETVAEFVRRALAHALEATGNARAA